MDYFTENEHKIPHGSVRTRFAPSPTGYMHVGGLRTALYTYLIAKQQEGQFILRIEDTDQLRLVEGATEVIYNTLRDAGLIYDEGPDVGGPVGPYIQSERRELYRQYAERLIDCGGAYRCFCTKEELEQPDRSTQVGDHTKYNGHCAGLSKEDIALKLAESQPFVIRQRIPQGGATTFIDELFGTVSIDNAELDDGVLMKADGLPTYNFANVIDDHLMGITHIVRGTEYLVSTPKYNLLYQSFGWEIPTYIHVSPVMKDAHRKLSKRHGDPTYEDLLQMGYLKEAILNYVALLGWSPGGEQEKYTLTELVTAFSISGLSKSPAIMDMEKLTWLNGEYIKELSLDRFCEIAAPYLAQAVKRPADTRLLASLVQGRCGKLTDIVEMLDFIDELPDYSLELYVHKKMKTDVALSLNVLTHVRDTLTVLDDWTQEGIHEAMMKLVGELGLKNGQVLYPLRVAVSGKASTPGGGVELCAALGKTESLARLETAITRLIQISH